MRKENKVIALAETRRRLPKSPKASQRNTRLNSASNRIPKNLVGLSPAEKRRKTILSKKRTILFERDIEYIGGDVFLEKDAELLANSPPADAKIPLAGSVTDKKAAAGRFALPLPCKFVPKPTSFERGGAILFPKNELAEVPSYSEARPA